MVAQDLSKLNARQPGYIFPPRSPSPTHSREQPSEIISKDQVMISSGLQINDIPQHKLVVLHAPSRLEYQNLQLSPVGLGPHRTNTNNTNTNLDGVNVMLLDAKEKETSAFSLVEGSNSHIDDESGIPFADLVDRLLSLPRSKTDTKFLVVFLCLYRKFATPSELLEAIIQRFEDLNELDVPDLIKLTQQLRCLNVLQVWILDYPGDLAHPVTRRFIIDFVQSLATSSDFAVAHREIRPLLEIPCDDDDTDWAFSNQRRSRASTMESFLTSSSTQGAASTVTADSSTEDIIDLKSLDKVPEPQSARTFTTPSLGSAQGQPGGQSVESFQSLPKTPEAARHQAQLLCPIPRYALDKLRWHHLVDAPEESIALELTRIDWILYSSIKPRDLVRDISLHADIKEKRRSLEHVNRMIDGFNHVAFWVANMILLRDKPKHRAIMLEKFMGVAWKLRYLNNYNSLGAIIAGINGTAVHRLLQTKELVSLEVRKQFMRLEILMGTAKSHSAYRLGWQNTSSPRIPFLPLHRRDLIFAEEGNRTFVSGDGGVRINWKKFEIMGDVIMEIRKSQELPYPTIKRNEEVQRLVLDGKFSKDEDVCFAQMFASDGWIYY